ncbi:Peroxisome assembly per8 [Hyphodiscus hymeniophilus]|uniref:RING-type E3 ubiquitin transferase n=1 Tax=Hyphodiscus hymeniophilus TaxID=353542 RepID=A0A9P6VMZ1_9HELO|nr:Peroxisome assembly per8 [Hyphodiscus hymeniophilus]
MADHISDKPSSETPSYNYPFAAAPDIIRSHQKDAYFEGILLNHLSNLLRRLYGARFLHTYTSEARTFSELLYLGLTTFIGNRTLGEEYCDIIQIEDDTLKLPDVSRRAGYIVTSILLPYGLGRILPSFRNRIRSKLELNLQRLTRRKQQKTFSHRMQSYLLDHLSTITSPSPIHALTLTIFYFSGAYYQLSKRIFGLRYIFTKRVDPSEARVGYEVLGVLLVLQMSVQAYLHLHSTINAPVSANANALAGGSAIIDGGVEVSLDSNAYATNNELLLESSAPQASSTTVAKSTHTEILPSPRYDLRENEKIMSWIKGKQQRKCTLCLEELKDPSAVLCGHVFCWACIGDWVREKPECPLCRREAMVQHILPLRV